jgi:hypothetical protein
MNTKIKKGIGGHQSHKMGKDEWLTPPEIITSLGQFDIDPCSPINRPWNTALNHYDINDNGLQKKWIGRVWCNPPYGKEASKWLEKLSIHKNGIALIFARTETKMFFDHVWSKAHSLLFIEGRLYFHHVNGEKAKSNSGAPSVLISYNSYNSFKLRNSGIKGKYIELGNDKKQQQ